MLIGCDTGFYKHLLKENKLALEVWEGAQTGSHDLVTSCISLYELRKLGLKGEMNKKQAFEVASLLPKLSTVIWLSEQNSFLYEQAALIAHGNALSMADALILCSLMSAGVERIYTTDSDFLKYKKGPQIIQL